MKRLILTLLASLTLQTMLSAQNTPATLDVQVQKLPSSNEGNYYDNSSTTNGTIRSNNQANTYANRPVTANKEQTLSIIKPDAVNSNHIGDIINRFEKAGLRIAAIKMVKLSKEQAGQFYQEHRERPFYNDLTNFISSGPVVVLVLEGDQAISKNRELMGATDPSKADKGTIRSDLAESVSQNAVHGSDSPDAARKEILFFFKPNDIQSRFNP